MSEAINDGITITIIFIFFWAMLGVLILYPKIVKKNIQKRIKTLKGTK